MSDQSSTPCVSVIIPVYNCEAFLERTLSSVLGQTLSNIEVICIDDGSSDGSLAVLERFAQTDKRLTVIAQENAGAAAVRNRGLAMARGEYLSFLDADDFFEPQMFEVAYEQAKRHSAQVSVFGCDNYYEESDSYTPCTWSIRSALIPRTEPFCGLDIERDTFKAFVGWAWDKLFLRSFVLEEGLTFQEQRTSNDLLFVFSAIVRAQTIVTTHRVLAHHRREAGGLSVTREKSWQCFHDALIALRDRLVEWGVYDKLEQDFINYALHFSLWNLDTLAEPTHSILERKLREEWFDELGITGHEDEYFYNAAEYEHYKRIVGAQL